MTKGDFGKFNEMLELVAAACGKRLTPDITAAYFRLLEDLPPLPLFRAMERFAKTAETGRKFPSPRELREWISVGAAPGGLDADQETRIRAHVLEAMAAWEREGRQGSAWSVFEVAWHSALVTEGIRGDLRPLHRQKAWQQWQWHGATTRETGPIAQRREVKAIYEEVAPKCSPLFRKVLKDIADRIPATSEDDDD